MKLKLNLMRSVEEVHDDERASQSEQLRQARVQVSRSQNEWVEIPESRLVRRGPYLVDAESDAVFTLHVGAIFDHGRASVAYTLASSRLFFFVSADDSVQFLEPTVAKTWTQMLERKHEKQRRHAERQAEFRAARQRILTGQ